MTDAPRFAELIVEVGANVQEGQEVEILADFGTEEVVRAIAGAAYRRGARYVDVWWWDALLKRERLLHARAETLDYVPPEPGARLLRLGEERGCRIWIIGNPQPHALEGIDPERAGRDLLPRLKESAEVVLARTTNWCIASWPTEGWARQVYPSLAPAEALERLTRELAHVSRLDEPDPAEAWRARIAELKGAAGRLTEREFESLHLSGPGTDLSVGLFASSVWHPGSLQRIDGLESIVNIPTEEVFTTPDPVRVAGVVRATKPLELAGSLIEGIVVRFEDGRAVQIDADTNVDVLRAVAAKDDGAARLGEVALVDGSGLIGALQTVFWNTLLDENASSHIALGGSYEFVVEDEAERARANQSEIHVDFMIGSPEVDVDGITRDGERVPVLRGGDWQI
ncbi:MAG: aminopeptidase [Gaiellaceae bacterium]